MWRSLGIGTSFSYPLALTYHDLPDGRQYPCEVLADPRNRLLPCEEAKPVEFRHQCPIGKCELRGADQALRLGQLRRFPHEQRQILATQIGMCAEISELF